MIKKCLVLGLIFLLAWPVLAAGPATSTTTAEEGQISRLPWSGFWWPLLDSKNPNLYDDGGPLDKYDSYCINQAWGNPDTQGWERENHSTSDPEADWWGHCHAWAAVSILEPEPLAAGYDAGIYFTVGDLKGLFTEAYYAPSSADNYGNRYNGNREDDKQDIYPDLFHRVLRYYVGQLKRGFVADIDCGEEVWNYPAYRYKMEFTPDSQYSDVTHVLATVYYADDAVAPDFVGIKPLVKEYTYWIQTSGNEIVDGEWEGDSIDDHPDFVWVPDGRDADATPVDLNAVKGILTPRPVQGCTEYFLNGDFETGDLAPWVGSEMVELAEEDTFSAWLGGYDEADDYLYQTVAIPAPATSVTLSYWWMMWSEEDEAAAYDSMKVAVQDPAGNVLKALETVDNGAEQEAWKQSTFDLHEFAGRTVILVFRATTDESNETSFLVDDVELQVCSGAQPTPAAQPTATPTIGPAPSGCRDAFLNGGFETGDFGGWDSGNMWTMMDYEPEVTDEVARSGDYSAWLGGYDDANDVISQRVVIPAQANRVLLSYWWIMETDEEEHAYDYMTVRLLDAAGNELAILHEQSDADVADQWVFSTSDLLRFAGREVEVSFEVTGDENNLTSFYVDDVKLEVCGGTAPAWRHRIFLPIVMRSYRR